MTLITEAERAEDIADAFSKFRSPLVDQGAEVASVIAELNGLSRALRDIDKIINSEYGRNIRLIQEDLDLVRASVDFTLEEIWNIIGDIGHGARFPTASDYRATWKDIHHSAQQSSRKTLTVRLEMYKLFLNELNRILRRRPVSPKQIEDLRTDIQGLLSAQDRRMISLTDAAEALTLTPVNKRSYERERLPSSPTSSRDNSVPPWLSSAPTSPPTAFSTTSRTSMFEMAEGHWACEVFRNLSVTPLDDLDTSDKIATCYGPDMPDAMARLQEDDMEQILKIGFPGGLGVFLFVREADQRARILCETPYRPGFSLRSCMPFNKMYLRRRQSLVELCSRCSGSNMTLIWASLPFTSMEKLVLFYNTCLALRSHDGRKIFRDVVDHELSGEITPFAGQIRDDGFLHALRVCRDHYSRAVRLQASVCKGEMKNTPVWTAFITHHILSPTWMRRDRRKVVCLRELRRHIFWPGYTPRMHESGEHLLEFITEDDASAFMQTIADLARAYR